MIRYINPGLLSSYIFCKNNCDPIIILLTFSPLVNQIQWPKLAKHLLRNNDNKKHALRVKWHVWFHLMLLCICHHVFSELTNQAHVYQEARSPLPLKVRGGEVQILQRKTPDRGQSVIAFSCHQIGEKSIGRISSRKVSLRLLHWGIFLMTPICSREWSIHKKGAKVSQLQKNNDNEVAFLWNMARGVTLVISYHLFASGMETSI